MTEPRISDDIDATSEHAPDDDSELIDHVAEEFARRCRRGESPTVAEYERRFPEHADKLRALLPSVAMMEHLKGPGRPSDEPGAPDPIPASLGEYRIVREIGRGGMGIVYEAFQESLGRHVALKVIPRHGLLDPRRRQRFQREAMAVARLHHTNIVPIFAAGEQDGLPYYAMQYIRGNGLDRLLDGWRKDGLSPGVDHWRFVARVGIQAAEALQYAHDQGIMHRDIKPANVLIDEQGVAWITDFGLAKLAGHDDLTHSGDVVGTLRYLAPESLSGQNDRRGDIYSLGLTLYELVTLRAPFGDLSPSELLRCVTEEQPIRPRKLDRSIPLDLETIVLKATAREPEHRYATAGELAEDLRAFLDDRPIRARRASPPARLARWCRRNRMLAGVSAFAAVSFLAALVFATAGYLTTKAALQKSNANVKLSLAAIDRLFNEFTDPSDDGPFADGWEPPGDGGAGPPPGEEPAGPPRRRGDAPAMKKHGLRGPGRGEGPPEPPPGEDFKLTPGTEFAGATWLSPREIALLDIVLDFYDGFARENETNAQLQGEAARAYRKVAALHGRLGHEREAEVAQSRALERLEALIRLQGDVPEYQYDMARALALDGAGPQGLSSDRAESNLRRAIAIVEGLFDRAPDRKRNQYAAALARWNGLLAGRLDRLGRTDEALAAYRASIDHDEWLAGHLSDPKLVQGVLVRRRAEFAEFLIRIGRLDEARPVVDRAADDAILLIGGDGRSHRGPAGPAAECLRSLAKSSRKLGDARRAGQLDELARQIPERDRGGWPGRRGGFGPDGMKRGPHGNGPELPPE